MPPPVPEHLIELGSGSSEKTRLLLDAMLARQADGATYVALDVSENALRSACAGLVDAYPKLKVSALRADFTHQLDLLPGRRGPNSGIPRRHHRKFRSHGTSHVSCTAFGRGSASGTNSCSAPTWSSPAEILIPAYDDAAGVTAAFNLNVLEVVNQRFVPISTARPFEHVAVWDSAE